MNGKHYAQTQTMQRERTCPLIHGSWRRVGIKLVAAGACALMAGQLLLPSVALAAELEGEAAAQTETVATPVTSAAPAAADDAAASAGPTESEGSTTAGQTDGALATSQGQTQQNTPGASAAQDTATVADANATTQRDSADSVARESGERASNGKIDIPGGGSTIINTTVRNNYTDTREDRTVDLCNGTTTVEGNYSSLNGEKLTFEGLGDLAVHATYDEASRQTTLSVDTSSAQREYEDQLYSTDYVEVGSLLSTTYERSELMYDGTTYGEDGTATVNQIRDDYYTRNHVWVKFRLTVPAVETCAISAITVEGAKTDYAPGEVPRATATVSAADADKYEIAYECWEEMGGSDPTDLTPVAYWYSDGSKYPTGAKRITQFEEGKFYMYSVAVRLKDGAELEPGSDITVNGRAMSVYLPTTDGLLIPNAASMLCEQPIGEEQAIDMVEIDGATTTFKAGDKPVFTAGVSANSNSIFQCEFWMDSDGSEVNSQKFWDENITNHIDAFKSGVTYRYGFYLKSQRGFYFTPDTKVKINGKFYNFEWGENDKMQFDMRDGRSETMWICTDLTMTPEAAPAPADPEKPNTGGTETPTTKPSDNNGQKADDRGDNTAKPRPASDGVKGSSKAATADVKTNEKSGTGELAATSDDAALTVVAMGVAGATVAAAGLAVSKRRG